MPPLFPLLSRRACTAALALILCAPLGAAFSQDTANATGVALLDESSVKTKDPFYREALFYAYQGRFFTATTRLMTSQQLAKLPRPAGDAETLRVGLLLSYGAHKDAAQVFSQLGASVSPSIRDRAEFYFARTYYQRGRMSDAEKAIGRIAQPLGPDLEEDRAVLKANLLMGRQDFAGAANELDRLRARIDLPPYARFNLGVALINSGQDARGIGLLDEIGKAPAATEEAAVLRDKANLALAVTALQANRAENARPYLERVRMNGTFANMALLQIGWADAALKRPREALVPWTELSVRTPIDPSVLEAKLSVPWAFAQLGAVREAIDRYNDALAIFEQERRELDVSIAAIRSGKLLAGLLARNAGEEAGWFWNIAQLPDMPYGVHVARVLAQHPIQEALKDYHDLTFLARNLDRWKERLAALKASGDGNERVAEAERKLRTTTARVATLLTDHQRYVQELVVAGLEAQKERLTSYDRQARFQAEQLYERGRKEATGAKKAR